METLIDAYEKSSSGSGQVVGLVGDAGVGKSRLLIEYRNKLPLGEFTYLEGQCFQYGFNIIYLQILNIVKSYFEIQDDDSEETIKTKLRENTNALDPSFTDTIPPLQHLLSLSVDDQSFVELDPKLKRERIFDSVRNILIKESEDKSLVIAIDDLHWIDKTSEEFLDHLINSLPNSRILLLLLYRPEYNHQWGGKSYYTQIRLDQLGEESSTELIQTILEDSDVAPELNTLIMEKAAGNPLYVEEFTQDLIENGNIKKVDDHYKIKGELNQIHVPDTIQGIIASRMDRLEENLKRIMQVASVIGRGFAFKILQTITGQQEELKSFLFNLQGLEFIYEKQLFPELEYIFKHALIQEVAYNSLLQKRRKEIHEQIAGAIGEVYADRMEEFYEMLVYHYIKADNDDRAVHFLKLAGKKASNNHAHGELLDICKQSLDIWSKKLETDEVKKIKINIYWAMWQAFQHLGVSEATLNTLMEGKRLPSCSSFGRRYNARYWRHSKAAMVCAWKRKKRWGSDHLLLSQSIYPLIPVDPV